MFVQEETGGPAGRPEDPRPVWRKAQFWRGLWDGFTFIPVLAILLILAAVDHYARPRKPHIKVG